MPTHPNFGHVPTTAAASKALAAGGASRKGRPSPFHRALESPELSYHHWWILTALRVRTAATALKLQEEEKAKLRAGFKTNGYGDLTSHTYGHITQDRRVQPYGFTVTKLHGFNKWKKRYSPIKSTHYVTSHLFDALHVVLKLNEQIERQDTQEKAAARAGFTSVKAHWRWHQRMEEEKDRARAAGFNNGVQSERRVPTTPAPLPAPKTVKFHLQAHERRIDDSAGIQHTA
jgi:hypothetical protein